MSSKGVKEKARLMASGRAESGEHCYRAGDASECTKRQIARRAATMQASKQYVCLLVCLQAIDVNECSETVFGEKR